jgi:hypothetical protein
MTAQLLSSRHISSWLLGSQYEYFTTIPQQYGRRRAGARRKSQNFHYIGQPLWCGISKFSSFHEFFQKNSKKKQFSNNLEKCWKIGNFGNFWNFWKIIAKLLETLFFFEFFWKIENWKLEIENWKILKNLQQCNTTTIWTTTGWSQTQVTKLSLYQPLFIYDDHYIKIHIGRKFHFLENLENVRKFGNFWK